LKELLDAKTRHGSARQVQFFDGFERQQFIEQFRTEIVTATGCKVYEPRKSLRHVMERYAQCQ